MSLLNGKNPAGTQERLKVRALCRCRAGKSPGHRGAAVTRSQAPPRIATTGSLTAQFGGPGFVDLMLLASGTR
jgi:hypothetical protein